MKTGDLLLLVLSLCSLGLKAQDTIAKPVNDTSSHSEFKFSTHLGRYYYNHKPIKEDKMHTVLESTNDKQLHYLALCADVSKNNRRIAYLAIPTGIACAATLIVFQANLDSYRNAPDQNVTHQLSQKE